MGSRILERSERFLPRKEQAINGHFEVDGVVLQEFLGLPNLFNYWTRGVGEVHFQIVDESGGGFALVADFIFENRQSFAGGGGENIGGNLFILGLVIAGN